MIEIIKNPYGDTRTAPDDYNYDKFKEANNMHREDMKQIMYCLGGKVSARGLVHDYTKSIKSIEFYNDFIATKREGKNFIELPWYKYHVIKERHHLNANCPEDVTLIDVIEMVADIVCAGLSRGNTDIMNVDINSEILQKAVTNTVEYIKQMITVKECE